ncbi:MAG: ABC transporter substrate-binding protein [Halomonas sp.]|uniref:ABC transporter substrate-binding protein n=1 Tax=Halomonas sp. TaxID=1486246 RepID=UPI001A0FE4ED|nr:ABC transporter substrate-binding protein [Halomonas sp.]MBE0490604.1 ABC transporter substrate-binding protein [Halomonas sp.]
MTHQPSTLKPLARGIAVGSLLAAGLALSANAQALTVISFGGASGDAMQKAYYGPFAESTGVDLTPGDYNGELSRIRAMVETGNVSWDLVEMESPELARGCFEGLFEPIDWDRLGLADELIDSAVDECGVGTFVWSTVLAYDADALDAAPGSWADFWDVEQFPGTRGLRRGAKYTLEFALMADGVAAEEVYEVLATDEGVDRAFAKLDEIKEHIQWWEAGAQPPQWLVAGDVVMTSSYNGRIAAAQEEGNNLEIVWNESLYDLDYWAIVAGSEQVDEAYDFIAFASQPETQAVYSSEIPYGPVHPDAIAQLDDEQAQRMPTHEDNLEGALAINTGFWVDFGEELEQRFNAWAAR